MKKAKLGSLVEQKIFDLADIIAKNLLSTELLLQKNGVNISSDQMDEIARSFDTAIMQAHFMLSHKILDDKEPEGRKLTKSIDSKNQPQRLVRKTAAN